MVSRINDDITYLYAGRPPPGLLLGFPCVRPVSPITAAAPVAARHGGVRAPAGRPYPALGYVGRIRLGGMLIPPPRLGSPSLVGPTASASRPAGVATGVFPPTAPMMRPTAARVGLRFRAHGPAASAAVSAASALSREAPPLLPVRPVRPVMAVRGVTDPTQVQIDLEAHRGTEAMERAVDRRRRDGPAVVRRRLLQQRHHLAGLDAALATARAHVRTAMADRLAVYRVCLYEEAIAREIASRAGGPGWLAVLAHIP
jgi:hypothetical protein